MSWLFVFVLINPMDLVIFEGASLWLIWVSGGVLFVPKGRLRVGRNNIGSIKKHFEHVVEQITVSIVCHNVQTKLATN